MDTLHKKLAHKREYFGLFLLCLLPINLWEILVFFYRASSMTLIMNAWEIAGVVAYLLAFALVEALALFCLLFILSLLLPEGVFETGLLSMGAIVIVLASIAGSLIHLHDSWDIAFISFDRWVIVAVLLALTLAGGCIFWMRRNERLAKGIRTIADRLEVLAGFYLALDLLGVCVVLIRNLGFG